MSDVRDLIIIGAGPAGYVGAIRAAQMGFSVTVIEKENVGGTCLNMGCMPTKTFLSFSEQIHNLKNPKKGISVKSFDIDVENIYSYKSDVVNKLKTGITGLFKNWNIELLTGTASFVSKNRIQVAGKEFEFKKALIATGSRPIIPKALFVQNFTVDSNYVLSNVIKGRIAIIGGGVIGTELAFILNSFGCDVTVIEKEPGLLPLEDRDCVRFVEMSLRKKGIKTFLGTSVEKIEKGLLYLQNGQRVEADLCVVAIGRGPNTEGLEPAKAGINLDKKGYIVTDNNFCTSNNDVYAVGDVIEGTQLAHFASACAIKVVESLSGAKDHIKLNTVPRITYSMPEIASVGINETQATAMGINFKTGRVMYGVVGKAVALAESDGIAKVIVDENDTVLGACIAGRNAELLLTIFAFATAMGVNVKDLSSLIYPHPSLSEIILEVCEDVHGRSIHKANRNTGRSGR